VTLKSIVPELDLIELVNHYQKVASSICDLKDYQSNGWLLVETSLQMHKLKTRLSGVMFGEYSGRYPPNSSHPQI
jgi:hypothetical protein